MSRLFAGEKTPAKASFLLTLKEDQQGRKKSDFAHTSLNCSYGLKAGYKMFSTRKFDFNFFVAFKEDLPFAAVPNSRHPFYDYKGSLQYNMLSLNFQILMQ